MKTIDQLLDLADGIGVDSEEERQASLARKAKIAARLAQTRAFLADRAGPAVAVCADCGANDAVRGSQLCGDCR